MNVDEQLKAMSQKPSTGSPTEGEWNEFVGKGHRSLARRRVGAVVALTAVIVVGFGVGRAVIDDTTGRRNVAPGGPDSTPSVSPDLEAANLQPVEVWFVQDGILYPTHQLASADVSVKDETEQPSRLVPVDRDPVERLLAGVPGPVAETTGAESMFPPGVRILNLGVAPRTTINLSSFTNDMSEEEMELAIAQVSATLLQLSSVHSVEVSEEGSLLTGGRWTMDSLENLGLLPPIRVSTPADVGQSFVDYVPLSGTANVFEATVSYELRAETRLDEDPLAEGFTTATCGSGCRGDFQDRVKFEVDARTIATLSVFEVSAEDGSRSFEVTIPVVLCPSDDPDSGAVTLDPEATC